MPINTNQQQQQQQQHEHLMQILNQSSPLNATLTSTLSRMRELSASYQQSQHLSSQFIHYDPVEWRRLHLATGGLLSHPPVPCEELAQHVERLRANANARLSAEYESIEPGQQFTWEHSTLDVNRAKNRYANVIAYDHSRVVLTKLPPHVFSHHHHHHHHSSSNSTSNSNLNHNPNDQLHLLPPPPPPPPGSTAHTMNTHTMNTLTMNTLHTLNTINAYSPSALSNCSDYINANYADGYRKRNCYIATQGPLPATCGDFWRMIWEQQTHTIVMLTKLEERSRLKCDQYWPSRGSQTYDNVMQVTLMDCQELATYTVRTFVLSPVLIYAQMQQPLLNETQTTRREIKHFQYTAWPEHGVPEHPTAFLMFIRRVKLYNSQQIETNCTVTVTASASASGSTCASPSNVGPIVVHCSAGVGRTGCFLAVDAMLERLKNNERSVYSLYVRVYSF